MHITKVRFRFWLLITLLLFVSVHCVSKTNTNLITRSDSFPETTPWDLQELSQTPEFEWADSNKVRSLYYEGEPFQGKPTRVFAYYATPGTLSENPNKDENLPAMVLVHGGGGTAFSQWVELWAKRGYAAIAMDLAGYGPNRERLLDGGPDQQDSVKFGQIEAPLSDQWTYHAVANVIRTHSLIRSFPEVNPNKTALTGISWGGYLTCIVAGLDNRFKAAVPIYGCGFLHHNSYWLHEFERMSAENKTKWITFWDPSQYVGSATMPMLFVNGGTDFAYPPDSYAKTYDLVQSPKNIRFVPHLDHGHIFDRPKAVKAFFEQHLKDGIPLAKITSMDINEDRVIAHVQSKVKLVSAKLYYTLEEPTSNPKTREWLTHPAQDRKSVV